LYLNDQIWTFNDSGGKNELYKIDKNTWKIIETKIIIWAKNIDWEDITQSKKYIFIWDIWNNRWNRKNLQIYKIIKKDFLLKNEKIYAEKINFSYSDILNEKEEDKNKKFSKKDAEALIFFKNNLYIFSKWWKDYNINIYKINPNKKNQVAKKISSWKLNGLITWATIYKNKVFLVWYKSIFVNNPFYIILSDFEKDNFFSWKIKIKKIFLNNNSAQIEAIDIWNKEIFLTCEKDKYASIKKQSLIYFNIKDNEYFLTLIKKYSDFVLKYLFKIFLNK
jgi:hypothetical protein